MVFHLKADESVSKGIRRIARKEIEKAQQELADPRETSTEEVVHGARKRFKRVRAVVRLVREGLGERRYRRENACFRDAARPLSEVRDAHALVQTLDRLAEHYATARPCNTKARTPRSDPRAVSSCPSRNDPAW
jgi:hypothetical protein